MSKPLAGITIVDFSRVLAAPLATQTLAELGAQVVKIERPGRGDETRSFEPTLPAGESAYFFAFNRGKQSITLDLKSTEGVDIARRLVAQADVVVENFLPGVMDSLGLGYETLRESNPELIYVATTGFGQTGPHRHDRGYDTIFQALSGIMSMTGQADGPPAKAGIPVSDMTSGLWVAIAVLTGLVGRSTSGHGCFVDVSMMDAQLALSALAAARVFAYDENPHRNGTEHPGRVPSAAFVCADEEWIHISASDQHWQPLCKAIGLEDLIDDAKYSDNSSRVKNRLELMPLLRSAIATFTRRDIISDLSSAGVPVGAVQTVREALDSEHAHARNIVQNFDHPTEGSFPGIKTPLELTGYDSPAVAIPPLLGADTHRILTERLSMTDDAVEDLRRSGVI
ncbi:CoA transferase [Rhodococcus fascians]|uniref:CaiB/BaiF CoA transferase family protein n=1 Tax=Rhodococcoides fascians TaxID=1828 RepID=UPI00195AB336|nr:CoA transferase [Rhodococcus fascians]MBM7242537.1 CoA transferase [Rhodococcus fascians]MBY3812007.1 CoA transferase [Rhodococcus fascians]MBY3840685.1 CoA transferase [Rhodococcus fascians]MBY3848183.1 CoA transferase [Rhodococcus fascians]MBY3853304.1 CoA transferase [Rhodococcus fascians]